MLRGHWSDQEELTILLGDRERWSAEVLESHLSYPVHAVVDLVQVLGESAIDAAPERLPASDLARLPTGLAAAGVMVDAGVGVDDKLAEMRRMYEPFVAALSEYLLMPLPAWRAGEPARANWRASRWNGRTAEGPTQGLSVSRSACERE